jgi:dUTP pyrophosphatase
MNTVVKIKKLKPNASIPDRQSDGAAGYDLHACIDTECIVQPGEVQLIPTGISCEIPFGFEIQIRPRSGLASREKLLIINSPGTIDSDYRGEFFVPIMNLNDKPFRVENGMRIAQIILSKVESIQWEVAQDLSATQRGEGGFGSSGI